MLSESQCIDFFGSKHVSRVYGSDYFDSDSAYKVSRGELELSFAIHPIHADVRVMINDSIGVVVDWSAMGLTSIDLQVKDARGAAIRMVSQAGELIVLRIAPRISFVVTSGPERPS